MYGFRTSQELAGFLARVEDFIVQSDANADVLQSDRLSTNKRSLDDWIVAEVLRHVYKLQKVHK
jgi:hypothetical protein